ncbi:MAG: hypothetical protein ACRDGV_13500, partial [Candidatus Limnocylindria bacterium]
MTANPRRPGFRLPWSAEQGEAEDQARAQEAASASKDEATTASVTTPRDEKPAEQAEAPAAAEPAEAPAEAKP